MRFSVVFLHYIHDNFHDCVTLEVPLTMHDV
jgi:hypothetical protein